MPPAHISLTHLCGSTNSGKHFTCIYLFIIKDITKDTNEQPDGGEAKGEVWEKQAEFLCPLQVHRIPGTSTSSARWKPPELNILEFDGCFLT